MTHPRKSTLIQLVALIPALALCMGAECISDLPNSRFLSFDQSDLFDAGFCEDWGPGLALHPNESCSRKEVCLFDCPQICEDSAGNRADSRDTISPVIGTAPNGKCIYDMPWDPIGGLAAHPVLWAHALVDIFGPKIGGTF